jgi:hypothetical protein
VLTLQASLQSGNVPSAQTTLPALIDTKKGEKRAKTTLRQSEKMYRSLRPRGEKKKKKKKAKKKTG